MRIKANWLVIYLTIAFAAFMLGLVFDPSENIQRIVMVFLALAIISFFNNFLAPKIKLARIPPSRPVQKS